MARRALPVLFLLPASLLVLAGGCHKGEVTTSQPEAAASPTPQKAPLAVVTDKKGKAAPTAAITDLAGGGQTDLSKFKGKPVLVNLWATWCVPCVKELPTLDALAKREDGKLQVVAISEDMEGAKVVPPFLAAHGVKTLHPYHDASNALMTALQEASLPVSILYDADGKEVWRVPGDLDWTGAKAKELLAQGGV
jgi:thiol-disulfide isomerase/thioredoxin